MASGQVVRRLAGHEQRINAVARNAEGTVLVTGSYDRSVRLWDLRAHGRDPMQTMSDARDSVTSLVVSGAEIFAGSVDGSVRTWDIRAGALRTDALGSPVVSVALSADGNCVLAALLDAPGSAAAAAAAAVGAGAAGALCLLEKASGALLNEYSGHRNVSYMVDACLTPDDAHVLCGSEDGQVRG